MAEDDRVWLDALAGRPPEDVDSVAVHEGQSLRAAIRARIVETEEDPLPAEDRAREEVLIARARALGVLPPRLPARDARADRRRVWPVWLVGWRGALAAVALASVVVAIGVYVKPGAEPEAVRGGPDEVVRLEARDPRSVQQGLLEELRAAGVQAMGYELLGRWGIDADLPLPIPPEVRNVLTRHAIPLPGDGVLRVEIAPETGR